MATQLHVPSLSGHSFGGKASKKEDSYTPLSMEARLASLREAYDREGMQRVVRGVLLVHQHGHAHVLLLWTFVMLLGDEDPCRTPDGKFKLPGGSVRASEGDAEGLQRQLNAKLSPEGLSHNWDIGALMSQWWRPSFEPHQYPYQLPHVTKPKQCTKMFLVPLPEKRIYAVPKHLNLTAVPLYALYNDEDKFGPMVCSIPHLLAQYEFTLL